MSWSRRQILKGLIAAPIAAILAKEVGWKPKTTHHTWIDEELIPDQRYFGFGRIFLDGYNRSRGMVLKIDGVKHHLIHTWQRHESGGAQLQVERIPDGRYVRVLLSENEARGVGYSVGAVLEDLGPIREKKNFTGITGV